MFEECISNYKWPLLLIATLEGLVLFFHTFLSFQLCCNLIWKKAIITEAHATKTLKNREQDDPTDVTIALHSKHQNHEDKHKCCLAAHNDELSDNVGEEYFPWRNTCHPTSV